MYICSATNDHHINTDLRKPGFKMAVFSGNKYCVLLSLTALRQRLSRAEMRGVRALSPIHHPTPLTLDRRRRKPSYCPGYNQYHIFVLYSPCLTSRQRFKKKVKMAGVRALPPPTPHSPHPRQAAEKAELLSRLRQRTHI